MEKKIHYVIEAALAAAIIILFVLQFSGNKGLINVNTKSVDSDSTSGKAMSIAYIDVDSLMSNYTYSIDLNEQLMKKYENARANMTEKVRRFETDANEFKRKIETGSFLSQERAENERQKLMNRQDELQKLEAQMQQELGEEQMRMNVELRKTIITQLTEYNKNKGFTFVFGKMNDNILLADNAYNITAEVIEFLNKQYSTAPTANSAGQ
ncbi:MAG: OmpH family outer membrane protein [Tannerella sp.]|jgi:outer membrane protein|nr:OmpH family outer membrane protein [Tannerella sp.]